MAPLSPVPATILMRVDSQVQFQSVEHLSCLALVEAQLQSSSVAAIMVDTCSLVRPEVNGAIIPGPNFNPSNLPPQIDIIPQPNGGFLIDVIPQGNYNPPTTVDDM